MAEKIFNGNGVGPQSALRVLVVDDVDSYRESLGRTLEDWGYEVASASSLNEARTLIEREPFQAVLMDINFGGSKITGDEFLLQHQNLMKGATKVVITGRGAQSVRKLTELESLDIPLLHKGDSQFESNLQRILSEGNSSSLSEANTRPAEPEIVAFGLFGNAIRLVSLTPDGSYDFLDSQQNPLNIVYVTSSETLALQAAIDELETLINDLNVKEAALQEFFERNPDFILNDDYKRAHPHLVLAREADGSSLVPDFVLEPLEQNALCDLLELKLPATKIFVLKKSRMRYSSAVLEACAQLREYKAFFDEEKNREAIRQEYGLLAYRPAMFVIIGRRGSVDPIVKRRIASDVPNLHLRTYDDVVNRVKARLDAMKKGKIR